tara:strand:+ start:1747 stop:2265 length:519 start_codon:yes stop_codon:yes gene_type:complete
MKRTLNAGLLALTAGSLPFASAAYAQEAPKPLPVAAPVENARVIQTSMSTSAIFVDDANAEATAWRNANREAHRRDPNVPLGIAFGVWVGTESQLTPEQLKTRLTEVSNDGKVENVMFFFQQNDSPAHGFALYYDDVAKGPYTTGNVINATNNAAAYVRADGQLFASNDYDG